MTLIFNNKTITKDEGLAINGVWQPLSYYENLTDDERADLGITKKEPVTAPSEPIAPIPITVSAWQIRKALNQLGLRQSVEDAVAQSDNQDLEDGWEYAKEFIENEPFVLTMAHALGLDDTQLHDLFALADSL